jgi:hypothetical protein
VLRMQLQNENQPGRQVPATGSGVEGSREFPFLVLPASRWLALLAFRCCQTKFTNDTDYTNNTSLEPRPQASYTLVAT